MTPEQGPSPAPERGQTAPAAPGAPPRRRPAWVLGLPHLALVLLAGLSFLVLGYLPLRPAELWGELTYGDWIRHHRALPAADPVLPLAEGMPVVDTAWLSQVLLATVDRAAGPAGLSTLFALAVVATFALLGRTFHRQTGDRRWATFGVIAAFALSWGAATSFGPHTFGALCLAVLLGRIAGSEDTAAEVPAAPAPGRWREPAGVAVLFVLWANLHASFVYGLAALAGLALGRSLEVAWHRRSLRALAADRPLRRALLLGEVAVAATLLNPYGVDLLLHALWLPASENLPDLPGWRPLTVRGVDGWAFAVSVVLLLVALRHSRRRVPASHALLLAFFGGAAALRSERLAEYGPVFALVVVPHLAEAAGRLRSSPPGPVRRAATALRGRLDALAGPSWHYSLLVLLVAWMTFAISPLGAALLQGAERTPAQTFPARTPLALVEYLRANPPRGLLFNPLAWGDWLVREGPPGLQPFVTSRVEQLPGRVWRDYLRIAAGEGTWPRILERYRVETVIFDRQAQREQTRTLRYSGEWRVAFEDDVATVFVRGASAVTPGEGPP